MDSSSPSLYGYIPHLAPGLVYTIVFGLLTQVHLIQMFLFRDWVFFVMVIGCIGELLGWIARTVSHYKPYEDTYYIMQSTVLIFAPCFFSAILYTMFGHWMGKVKPSLSPLRPKMYVAIFTTSDFISLCIQGAGGGKAATSSSGGSAADAEAAGNNIIVAGIALQLALTVVFVILMGIYLRRAYAEGLVFTGEHVFFAPDERVQRQDGYVSYGQLQQQQQQDRYRCIMIVLYALLWTAFWIVIRCIYRLVELGMGWDGYVNTHEWFITVFDAAPMVLVVYGLVLGHPGYWLRGMSDVEEEKKGVAYAKKAGNGTRYVQQPRNSTYYVEKWNREPGYELDELASLDNEEPEFLPNASLFSFDLTQ